MAMCARKDLMAELQKRRAAFSQKIGKGFCEQLKEAVSQRMVAVKIKQERRHLYVEKARKANCDLYITR